MTRAGFHDLGDHVPADRLRQRNLSYLGGGVRKSHDLVPKAGPAHPHLTGHRAGLHRGTLGFAPVTLPHRPLPAAPPAPCSTAGAPAAPPGTPAAPPGTPAAPPAPGPPGNWSHGRHRPHGGACHARHTRAVPNPRCL